MFKEFLEARSVFNKDAGYRPLILAKDELPELYPEYPEHRNKEAAL